MSLEQNTTTASDLFQGVPETEQVNLTQSAAKGTEAAAAEEVRHSHPQSFRARRATDHFHALPILQVAQAAGKDVSSSSTEETEDNKALLQAAADIGDALAEISIGGKSNGKSAAAAQEKLVQEIEQERVEVETDDVLGVSG